MVEIKLVPVHLARAVWTELHTQLKGAMRYHPAMNVDDLLVLLESNMVAIFVAIIDDELKGAFIVNVEEYPRRRVCNIVAVAGRRGSTRAWIDEMLETLEEWAIQRGCDLLAGIGRKGWMVARDFGFKTENRAILIKDLANERRRRQHQHDSTERSLERNTTVPPAAILERE